MTIPWLMNCAHSDTGWCLDCVAKMGNEFAQLRRAGPSGGKKECFVVPAPIMERIDAALRFYGSMETYLPPRTGGVLHGCPRSGTPPITDDHGKFACDLYGDLVKLYPLEQVMRQSSPPATDGGNK